MNMKDKRHIKSFRKFNENLNISHLFESEDSLYRSIKKYYKTFLTSWLDDNDPDRDFGLQIDLVKFESEFIQDCIDMFGVNGTEEYNSGYDDELVKKVCKRVLDEEE